MSSDVPARDLNWLVSPSPDGGAGVKVARCGDSVLLSTTSPEGAVITFTMAEWRHFVAGAKLGDFDDIA